MLRAFRTLLQTLRPAAPAGATFAGPADADRGSLILTHAPPALRPYLLLARMDRPIGWWLLLLPCLWSAGLAAIASGAALPNLWHCLLFLVGSIAMRGAGCVWNDVVDRDLDAQVARTRGRPIPSGAVTVRQALLFAVGLCLVGLAVLLSFNWFTVALGLASMIPVALYPFAKRFTDYPQVVLGLTFAYGALMGWAAAFGSLSPAPVLLYLGSLAWVVGYDTIYALQDKEDDGIVGIRSTAITFGEGAPGFVAACYAVAVLLIGGAVVGAGGGLPALLGVAAFAAMLARQVVRIDLGDGALALTLFKSNRDCGLVLFAALTLDALL
jgi:4-hydroxybenzoate polyprenyltransferase